jgi:type IV pilus assembly protein PilQ
MIAQKTGLNIIMSRAQVTGTITLDLEDVPLGNALDAILKTSDLAFVREAGGIVRIVQRKEIRVSALELKTVHIPVNWVPATRLAETLKPFLSKAEGSQIQADGDSNAILITDTPPSVETLLALVEKLDVPEKQVMIEMRLVDIGKDLLRDIGMNWSLNETQRYTGGKPITQTTTTLNPITGQVEKVVETVTGYTDKVAKYDVPDSYNSATGAASGLGSNLTWGRMVSIFGQDFDFDSFVNANQNKSLIKVLSNPRVITLNNVPAKIEIINEIPYLNSLAGSGGSVTVQAEFKESGITMEVTPYVTNNGYVRMKIKPDQKIYRGPDKITHTLPQIDRRSAETNVIVRDEETVLLGGLRQATDTDATLGTPWFMDIPVIGWFFKSNSTVDNKLEMVMFVTPHIIKEPALSELEKTQYEQIDYGWDLPAEFFKSKKEMPGAKK